MIDSILEDWAILNGGDRFVPLPYPYPTAVESALEGWCEFNGDEWPDGLRRFSGLLRGYGGEQFLEVGYFYAPYIPIVNMPVVIDPDEFMPKIMTRYGKKLLEEGGKFYSRMNINETTDR